jgi:hypothetical protein
VASHSFLRSAGGRIAIVTTAWAAAAPAVLSYSGLGKFVAVFVPLSAMLIVLGFLFAVGLSLERFWKSAVAMAIGLPLVAGFYLAACFIAPGQGLAFRLAWLAGAGVVLTFLLRPAGRSREASGVVATARA